MGQNVIITGASEGIGKATAVRLANEGANLTINARNPEQLDQIVSQLTLVNPNIIAVAGDITSQQTVDQLASTSRDTFGLTTILINNVGGGSMPCQLEDIDDEQWVSNLNTNLTTSFRMCRAVVQDMKTKRYGRIVNVSSVAGRFRGNLSGTPYSTAKAGLHGLTRDLASRLGQYGITVNAAAPGITATPRAMTKWQEISENSRKKINESISLGRFAEPEEIAAAIAFLASDDASYVTGATLDINGGIWMG